MSAATGPSGGAHAEPAAQLPRDPHAAYAELGRRASAGERSALPLAREPIERARGPGRPKGSRNLRTEAAARALCERYGDPLEADVAIGSMTLVELITQLRIAASDCGLKLGATVMDVARFQADCRRNALPYIHARRAPTNEQGETVTPILAIGAVGAPGQVVIGGRSIEDMIIEADQGLSEAAAAVSHDGKSHDEPSD